MPTRRGRNQLLHASGTIPRRAKTNPNFAASLAIRTSIGSVSVTPTPTAAPLMAAITGFLHSKMRSDPSPPPSRCSRAACSSLWSKVPPPLPRSAPAQKARPAPVTIATRISSFWSISSKTWSSSASIFVVSAFIRSGRFSVTVSVR